MTVVKYLLVGGGLASYHASKRIRRNDPDGKILIIGDEAVPPYDLPSLSKEYLRGVKTDADIIYETEISLAAKGVECYLETAAIEVEPAAQWVRLSNGVTVHYEKLLLATGTRPRHLDVPGSSLSGVHYLRTISDSRSLRSAASTGRKAVIVGGGFIGLEVAASLIQMGLHVTLIESMPEIWPRFADRQLACFVREHCESRGLVVRTGQQLDAILGEDGVTAVRLRGGETISCDLVCVGIGVIPNVELALEASLEVENGIVVNHRMQTSNANIFSAGDVANYPDPVAKVRKRAEHWGHAEYSGQIAGANMSGGAIEYDFMSYVWSDIFDLHLEAAGDEGGGTTSIRRGMMTTSGFTMLYLDDDRLISYCGLNANPKEFTALRKLIRNGTSLKGREDELADPSIPIKSFL